MLDNQKIKIMTDLAIYEKKKGREDIKIARYYKTDYVRYKMITTLLTTSLGYALILALIFIYQLEHLIKQAVVLDYKSIGTKILGVYIIILVIYGAFALIGYSIKYDSSRKKLGKYYRKLRHLEANYSEEANELKEVNELNESKES